MLTRDVRGLSTVDFLLAMRPYFALLANAHLIEIGPDVKPPTHYASVAVRFSK